MKCRDEHEALGEIGDPEAVPTIVRAIGAGDFELQKIASWALAQLGTASK